MKLAIGLAVAAAGSGGGCNSKPAADGEGQARVARGARGEQSERVECYAGESKVSLPDGRTFPAGVSLAKRTISPAKGTIVEQVISASSRPGEAAREFLVDMKVSGQSLTLAERSGAFTGTGTLTGPDWAWTAWTTETTMPGGMRVVSKDSITDEGLAAEKQVFRPDGVPQVRLTERFTRISEAEFERRRAELLRPAASSPANPAPSR